MEQFVGADWGRALKRWMHKVRVFNRRDGEYHEVVTDPETGTIIREKHEPLPDHWGHGSAKRRKP